MYIQTFVMWSCQKDLVISFKWCTFVHGKVTLPEP